MFTHVHHICQHLIDPRAGSFASHVLYNSYIYANEANTYGFTTWHSLACTEVMIGIVHFAPLNPHQSAYCLLCQPFRSLCIAAQLFSVVALSSRVTRQCHAALMFRNASIDDNIASVCE